ncbi:NAD(P)-dependent oxidoreductase [Alkalimonas sp. MEB108]|uniref:NAD(P)-dependent oxidoreductase n=1 Tax=Alkalimonas cellulosilytica TaxID=3058395 RepID=A0ABU7J1Y4_9GAMM|nr:NAD(P)-dependent oxidoreductase [Alkalimonas sp. MEB108]MEE2000486.1 NAD(P)-dependent oxidoreductase [Alkalimonas sp. MEB108]
MTNSANSKKVAFIGLGVMGYPMAGYLQHNGHETRVYNRTSSKAQQWVKQYGGQYGSTPAEAAQGSELVFLCVGNDDDVRSVVYGEHGVLASMQPGSVLIDHTTASAELARELAAVCAKQGIGFLDAPVSGGQAGAENGVLTIMVGGDSEAYAKAEPVMQAYARCCKLLGPAGSGQLAKMVNQICIAGVVQGLAEGLHFAQNAGLDAAAVVEVISQGAAQSWQMQNRYQTMLKGEYDFGFAVDWMRKDLAIALNEARKNGSHLPLTALVDQFYSEVQRMGGNRWDTSSLLARLQK